MRGSLLQKTFKDSLKNLAHTNEAERLRLAVAGAREAAFDWTIADDHIVWEGADSVLEGCVDPVHLQTGKGLSNWMNESAREKLLALVNEHAPANPMFEMEFETGSSFPSEWFEIRAVRLAGPDGHSERVTGVLRVITEHMQRVTRLTYLATYDELTGHVNRTRLREELTSAIARASVNKKHCTYFVAAIDNLAVINETYGFAAADEVIVATGRRLAETLRGSDVIGRTAGNKFGIILAECGEEEMTLIAERLHASVRDEVIETSGGTVSASISMGAVWLPANGCTSQEAMLHAEEALDTAKGTGRNGFVVYIKSPQRESTRRRLITIADDVMAALNDHRLVFAYQPIVGAISRRPEHYECLLRLTRKDGTIAAAGEFIPAAETLGLVRLVDRRVLEMAVSQLYANPAVKLSINVSGTTAGDPSWLQSFITYVHENRKVAERITVELTETAAINAFEENARFVSRLRDMGCRVAIDDFGAGFTSFRNLHMLRVDMVKIDGAYVRELTSSPDNQLFVRTLVDLAKNFQLETVAEWVGSEQDAVLLKEFGVDYFQGYYFGEPNMAPSWPKPLAA